MTHLDLDLEGFAERLGRGLERFQAGDLSMFATEAPARGPSGQQQIADVLCDVVTLATLAAVVQAGLEDTARQSGLDDVTIQLVLERGRRAGIKAIREHAQQMLTGLAPDRADAGNPSRSSTPRKQQRGRSRKDEGAHGT